MDSIDSTGLYQINIDGTSFKGLTNELKSARSPRLNKDGTTLVSSNDKIEAIRFLLPLQWNAVY
jgi:Tol biopolymer transport system component